MEKQYISIREYAKKNKISRQAAYYRIKVGLIKVIKIAGYLMIELKD